MQRKVARTFCVLGHYSYICGITKGSVPRRCLESFVFLGKEDAELIIGMQSFIIIKGQPKALEIEKIQRATNGVYDVKFQSSPRTYHYRQSDVLWLEDAEWHDPLHCKVYLAGKEKRNITDILSFQHGDYTHWRITFENGTRQDYLHGSIHVVESCLTDEIAKNAFEYLKRIALVNELGKEDDGESILSALYDKIDFIDKELAAAPYLGSSKYHVKHRRTPHLIFPFGCNSSQEQAVTAAFENQISVIQGPPGTGKTQTILNIIANILMQGKTVIVVSNNNSATTNVLDKLQKYGLHFIVAPLGKRDNKEEFVKNQQPIPQELPLWELSKSNYKQEKQIAYNTLSQLRKVYTLQEELAISKQELQSIELEWGHFKQDHHVEDNTYIAKNGVKAKRLMNLWLRYQTYIEGHVTVAATTFGKFIERMKWMWMNLERKYIFGVKSPLDKNNIQPILTELQASYYLVRMKELTARIEDITQQLSLIDAKELSEGLTSHSMKVLKSALYNRYHNQPRRSFTSVKELHLYADALVQQYPVVLSTTFSAKTAVPDMVFDYLIMDEASQVSIETGALALTCAKNAVIVGDTLQLPNVVTEEDKVKLDAIFHKYQVPQGYHCAKYSFLQSVCTIIPNVKQTLLKEHYRCHPKIINFCNQRFYGGNLIIMTEDHEEDNVMMAFKTVPGHHTRGHYNQREIDVVKQEVIPSLEDVADIGIISPYNQQVDEFNKQIPYIEAATIHKYQGREKDTIIMSVVEDQITEFADDPNLLNVAISRAKKCFCLVVSGNEQERQGNIKELIDYIEYNNFSVTDSKINSIFDYLYSHYTAERIAFLSTHRNISEYDSENLTYSLIENILHEIPTFSHLGILCHTPLRTIIKDWSLLNEEERKYISHYATHLDFLIINHVTKKPILAIETDGYTFHHHTTDQHRRDLLKNHILDVYGLPFLRLSTTDSGEKEKIIAALSELV